MRRKKITLLVTAGLLVASLAFYGVLTHFTSSERLVARLKQEVLKNCPTCQIDIGSARLSLMKGILIGERIEYHGDAKESVVLDVKLKSIELSFVPRSLWFGSAPRVTRVLIDGLDVTVNEDPLIATGPSSAEHWMQSFPRFRVEAIQFQNSNFTYRMKVRQRWAKIGVNQIQGEVSAFGTREDISPTSVDWFVHARLENSGVVQIQNHMDLFLADNQDRLEIRIEKQDLRRLDPFFSVLEGLRLSGEIDDTDARLSFHQGRILGRFVGSYHGLRFSFSSTRDRGSLGTFFANLGHDMMIQKNHRGMGERSSIPISAARKNGHGVIHWILAALSPAAQTLMTQRQAPEKKQTKLRVSLFK